MIRALCALVACLHIVACSAQTSATGTSTKRIALTYDDAPRGDGHRFTGPERTAAFIAQLSAAETGPVAMFITTRGMDTPEGKQRVADYAAAGHLIANHTDQHTWASSTPTEDYIADIDLAEQKLSGLPNRRAWFRFPYLDEGVYGEDNQDGVKRDALRAALAERDLMSGYVTVDTYDWHLNMLWRDAERAGQAVDMQKLSDVYVSLVLDAADHYDALAQEVLGRRPAQVVLLHENELAATFTTDLVAALRADGWTIIHPDEAFADPIAEQLPDTLFSGMGRISALAHDAGLRGPEVFDHWSVNEEAIETKVAEAGVFASDNP